MVSGSGSSSSGGGFTMFVKMANVFACIILDHKADTGRDGLDPFWIPTIRKPKSSILRTIVCRPECEVQHSVYSQERTTRILGIVPSLHGTQDGPHQIAPPTDN